MARISQREARRLRQRVQLLEAAEMKRRRSWSMDWPGGVNVETLTLQPSSAAIVRTARRLGHAVVVVIDNGDTARLMALPHPGGSDLV